MKGEKDIRHVTAEAMAVLRPLYQSDRVAFDNATGEPFLSHDGPVDEVRKEILGVMAEEAAGRFLSGKGTYASALLSVCSEGRVFGLEALSSEEALAAFYVRHESAVFGKVSAACAPGLDVDVAKDMFMVSDKAAMANFVVDHETGEIFRSLGQYRDKLERLERPAVDRDAKRSLKPRVKAICAAHEQDGLAM